MPVAFSGNDIVTKIGPGSFYFTVSGNLQNGVYLSGLLPSRPGVIQEGYWTGEKGSDIIFFHDSSNVAGFRLMMSLSGDFIYSGLNASQGDIPMSNFKIYTDWDRNLNLPVAPTFAEDDLSATLSLDTLRSCNNSNVLPYSNYYTFNSDFYLGDYDLRRRSGRLG